MAKIQDYRFGRVVVEGQPETRDLILLPGRVVRNWWRRDGHALVFEDLEDVLDELPERLSVGMGASSQMRPDPATLERLRDLGHPALQCWAGRSFSDLAESDVGSRGARRRSR